MQQKARSLTHDEKKAAEAAFRGVPFDPKWSESARKVYLGISAAIKNKRDNAFEEITPSRPSILTRKAVPQSKPRSHSKSTFW